MIIQSRVTVINVILNASYEVSEFSRMMKFNKICSTL